MKNKKRQKGVTSRHEIWQKLEESKYSNSMCRLISLAVEESNFESQKSAIDAIAALLEIDNDQMEALRECLHEFYHLEIVSQL